MLRIAAVVSVFALVCYCPVLPARADTAKSLNDKGLAELKQERYAAAVDAFKRALRLSPGSKVLQKNLAYSHAGWGVAYLDKQQSGPAIKQLRLALERYKLDVGFNFWLAVAYYRNRNYFDATVELRYVLEKKPKRQKAWEYLGYCYYQRNRLPQAIEAWEKSLALNPKDDNLRGWLKKVRRESKVESTYTRNKSSHFQLIYDGNKTSDAARVVNEMLEDAYRDLGSDLGVYPRGAVTVILYPQRAFYSVTGSHKWVGGLFDGKIRLPIQNLRTQTPRLARLIRHEYAHVLITQLAPRCPVWLNEGLAQVVEGGDHRKLVALVASKHRAAKLLPFAALTGNMQKLGSAAKIRLAYAQSYSFVKYLDRLYSRRALSDLLKRIGAGMTTNQAFKAVFKLGLAELEALWKRTL